MQCDVAVFMSAASSRREVRRPARAGGGEVRAGRLLMALFSLTAMTRRGPLAGVNRTSRGHRRMTDFDPTETWAAQDFCSAKSIVRCFAKAWYHPPIA